MFPPNCPHCGNQIDLHHVISASFVDSTDEIGDTVERTWWAECSELDCEGMFYLHETVKVDYDEPTFSLVSAMEAWEVVETVELVEDVE